MFSSEISILKKKQKLSLSHKRAMDRRIEESPSHPRDFLIFFFSPNEQRAGGGGGGGGALPDFFFFFFSLFSRPRAGLATGKVVFFGLATYALNVRNNNKTITCASMGFQKITKLSTPYIRMYIEGNNSAYLYSS